jgi:hypothetical protein
MHYELVAQCNPTERNNVIQKIEMSGGKIKDILEDQDKLLLFIEYDESITQQKKAHLLEVLADMVTHMGDAFTFPTPTA